MATLSDGNQVFVAAAGNSALASDQNSMQTSLITLFNGLWHWVPLAGFRTASGTVYWDSGDGHLDSTVDSSKAQFAIPFHQGYQITATKCILAGEAGKTSGSVTLSIYDGDGTMTNLSMKGASSWPSAGIGYANASTFTGVSPSASEGNLSAGKCAVVEVDFGADQATYEGEVWGLAVQFNKGQ